jgi:hypothetical protein
MPRKKYQPKVLLEQDVPTWSKDQIMQFKREPKPDEFLLIGIMHGIPEGGEIIIAETTHRLCLALCHYPEPHRQRTFSYFNAGDDQPIETDDPDQPLSIIGVVVSVERMKG